MGQLLISSNSESATVRVVVQPLAVLLLWFSPLPLSLVQTRESSGSFFPPIAHLVVEDFERPFQSLASREYVTLMLKAMYR